MTIKSTQSQAQMNKYLLGEVPVVREPLFGAFYPRHTDWAVNDRGNVVLLENNQLRDTGVRIGRRAVRF